MNADNFCKSTLALPRGVVTTPRRFFGGHFFPDGVNKIASVQLKPYHFDTFCAKKHVVTISGSQNVGVIPNSPGVGVVTTPLVKSYKL